MNSFCFTRFESEKQGGPRVCTRDHHTFRTIFQEHFKKYLYHTDADHTILTKLEYSALCIILSGVMTLLHLRKNTQFGHKTFLITRRSCLYILCWCQRNVTVLQMMYQCYIICSSTRILEANTLLRLFLLF